MIGLNKGALPSTGVTSGSELVLPKSVLFLHFLFSFSSKLPSKLVYSIIPILIGSLESHCFFTLSRRCSFDILQRN